MFNKSYLKYFLIYVPIYLLSLRFSLKIQDTLIPLNLIILWLISFINHKITYIHYFLVIYGSLMLNQPLLVIILIVIVNLISLTLMMRDPKERIFEETLLVSFYISTYFFVYQVTRSLYQANNIFHLAELLFWFASSRKQRILVLINLAVLICYFITYDKHKKKIAQEKREEKERNQEINENNNEEIYEYNRFPIENNIIDQNTSFTYTPLHTNNYANNTPYNNPRSAFRYNFDNPGEMTVNTQVHNRATTNKVVVDTPIEDTSYLKFNYSDNLSLFKNLDNDQPDLGDKEDEVDTPISYKKGNNNVNNIPAIQSPITGDTSMDIMSLSTFLGPTPSKKRSEREESEEESSVSTPTKSTKKKKVDHYLRKKYRDYSYSELVDSPITAFTDVPPRSSLFTKFNIKTIGDLAKWKYYLICKCICELATVEERDEENESKRSRKSFMNINHSVKKDYEKLTFYELAKCPVICLQGISEKSQKLFHGQHIFSVSDFANWKIFQYAEAFVIASKYEDNGEEEMEEEEGEGEGEEEK